MRKSLSLSIIIIIILLFGIYVFVGHHQGSNKKKNKITVITTIFPLYDFVRIIGNDKVEVSMLLPPGIEVHSFEPKPSEVARIYESDVFVYTGKFMEPWVEGIIKGIVNKNVKVVDSSENVNIIQMDPHIWLDFGNAGIMVDNIARGFSEKDPVNADYYTKRAKEYKGLLSKIDNEYKTTISKCKKREIIYAGHYAFGYLASRYGLRYMSAMGISPDAEPTALDLVRLVERIKRNNIKYIFYEELSSPKIADTLAEETHTKMLLLNAAHNITKKDFDNNVTFVSIMENNLRDLKIGLEYME